MQGDTVLHKMCLSANIVQKEEALCGAAPELFPRLSQPLVPIPGRYGTPHDGRHLVWSTVRCTYYGLAQKDPRTGSGVSPCCQLVQVQHSRR